MTDIHNIVVLTDAGICAENGIATFRRPERAMGGISRRENGGLPITDYRPAVSVPLRTSREWANSPPMDFSDVDPVIERWVKHLGATLFSEWNGEPARFFHIPGDSPFECFQISVERSDPQEVTVHARAIDTNDNNEHDLDKSWIGTPSQLDALLARASEAISGWKARSSFVPNPSSPR